MLRPWKLEVECPNCGASLPASDPPKGYRFTYCGTEFELRRARSAKTVARVRLSPDQLAELARSIADSVGTRPRPLSMDPAEIAERARAAHRRARNASIARFVLALGVTGTMVAVAYYQHARPVGTGGISIPAVRGMAGSGGVEGEGMALCDDTVSPPIVLEGDRSTRFLARLRLVEADDALVVRAFDASTGKAAYTVDDLGTYGTASRFVHMAVAGDDLLVTTPAPSLRILDVASGSLRRAIPLRDRSESLCTDPKKGRAHLELGDGGVFVVEDGKLDAAERMPRGCRDRHELENDGRATGKLLGSFVETKPLKGEPRLEGVKTLARCEDGDGRTVLVGTRAKGTAIPLAGAFEGEKMVWSGPIADVSFASLREDARLAAVERNALLSIFGAGQGGWRMTALDTRSGDRLWSVEVEPLFSVD